MREAMTGQRRAPAEETLMTRELKSGVEDAVRVGRRRDVRRKCARWLVANTVSKPSIVVEGGIWRTPDRVRTMFEGRGYRYST